LTSKLKLAHKYHHCSPLAFFSHIRIKAEKTHATVVHSTKKVLCGQYLSPDWEIISNEDDTHFVFDTDTATAGDIPSCLRCRENAAIKEAIKRIKSQPPPVEPPKRPAVKGMTLAEFKSLKDKGLSFEEIAAKCSQ